MAHHPRPRPRQYDAPAFWDSSDRAPDAPGHAEILKSAQALAAQARAAGLVLTIEQTPTPGEPLSMGRHVDVVSVREAR